MHLANTIAIEAFWKNLKRIPHTNKHIRVHIAAYVGIKVYYKTFELVADA